MKVRIETLSKKERIATLDALYTAVSSVHGRLAMKLLLRDLLTESERVMLGRRILIARLLLSGESYEAIGKALGVGTNTIRRVHRWLNDEFPGYEDAIKGLEETFERRKRGTSGIDKYLYATSELYRLKKKYPIHFFLFPLPKRKSSFRVRRKSEIR